MFVILGNFYGYLEHRLGKRNRIESSDVVFEL